MRFITWNCRVGGFRTKSRFIAPLRPDILAVQEVEPLDKVEAFAGDIQPTFRDRRADPAFPRRATGVFSYTGIQIRAVDQTDPMYSFRRYEVQSGALSFNVVAVWPWQTKSTRTAYRQAHEGIAAHSASIRQRPTVVLGDFNANAGFKGTAWADLLELMAVHKLASVPHRHRDITPGRERHPTHFHTGREDRPFHLDYCFVPEEWVERIESVEIGSYADWHNVSDHAPLCVDIAL